MKRIGIVRRLDELGRIVIPREFRKTHRINVGDPLEISATDTGSIIINKVDNTSDLSNLGQTVCDTVSRDLNLTVAVSNFERILSCVGPNKHAIIERELPLNVSRMLKNRGYFNGPINSEEVSRFPDIGFNYIFVAPILSYDECFGGIIAFSESPISESHATIIRIAARLLGDTLQKY